MKEVAKAIGVHNHFTFQSGSIQMIHAMYCGYPAGLFTFQSGSIQIKILRLQEG